MNNLSLYEYQIEKCYGTLYQNSETLQTENDVNNIAKTILEQKKPGMAQYTCFSEVDFSWKSHLTCSTEKICKIQ